MNDKHTCIFFPLTIQSVTNNLMVLLKTEWSHISLNKFNSWIKYNRTRCLLKVKILLKKIQFSTVQLDLVQKGCKPGIKTPFQPIVRIQWRVTVNSARWVADICLFLFLLPEFLSGIWIWARPRSLCSWQHLNAAAQVFGFLLKYKRWKSWQCEVYKIVLGNN